MVQAFVSILKMALDLLLSCMKWVMILLIPFVVMMLFYYFYYYIKGYRVKKRDYVPSKKRNLLKRLLLDFPNRFILDLYNRDPNEFQEYGVHLVAGEQGSGKTIFVTYLLREMKKKYPLLKIRTNYCYKEQDGPIEHWKDIVFHNNGIYGEIDVIDEIQTWFSSMQSLNFPPEMLQEISQQRKQRKMIIGTSQVWTKVAKPIREQTTFLYLPMTILGCLTIVRKYHLTLDCEGQIKEKRLRNVFFFVHDQDLRNSYDTRKRIETLAKSGFKEQNDLKFITEQKEVL